MFTPNQFSSNKFNEQVLIKRHKKTGVVDWNNGIRYAQKIVLRINENAKMISTHYKNALND